MYARSIEDREFTFDFADGLVGNNLLIVDRETDSVWSQLAGAAIEGPMEGTLLSAIPAMQATWRFWRDQHPDTEVMIFPDTDGKPYLYRNIDPNAGPRREPTEHDTSSVGLGLVVDGTSWFFPLEELEGAPTPLELEIAGRPVTVHHDPGALTAWANDADGQLMMGVMAYEDGWRSFHPDTDVYDAQD